MRTFSLVGSKESFVEWLFYAAQWRHLAATPDFLISRSFHQINRLKSTGFVHHQFNIQQLYALPTLYLCVLYLSENKQRLMPLTA
jgi:hypothetical protein